MEGENGVSATRCQEQLMRAQKRIAQKAQAQSAAVLPRALCKHSCRRRIQDDT